MAARVGTGHIVTRFQPPIPNCGHLDQVTFTHVPLAKIWMCALCIASIGALYVTCARCGRPPAPDMQLASTSKGRLCNTCLRDFRAGHRGAPS